MASYSSDFSGPSRIFTVMAGGSALLCVSLMVFWLHSAAHNDVLMLPSHSGDHWLVTSGFGTLTVQWEDKQTGNVKPGWVFMENRLPRNWPNDWRWFYFRSFRGISRHYLRLRPARIYGMSAPHWPFIVMLGILPVIWEQQVRRNRQRRAQGLCPACGYDLRATAVSGGPLLDRCPECGLIGARKDGSASGHHLVASVGSS